MVKKIIGGSIIIIAIIAVLLIIPKNNKRVDINNTTGVNDRYNTQEYYGYLKIPSVNLDLGFYNYDHPLNDVAYNIELIEIPVADSYLIAAHSGVGQIAYFNDLHKVLVGDDIYLSIADSTMHYRVSNIYRTIKDGDIAISNKSGMIYLTTCDQIIDGYQLVIEGMLVS